MDAGRRALYDQGMNDGQIAAALGLTRATILRWRKRQGLASHCGVGLDDQATAVRLALYRSGLSDRAIGARLGLSQSAVIDWRNRKRLPPNNPDQHSDVPHSVRALYVEIGMTDRQIARVLGLTRADPVAGWRKRRGLSQGPGIKGQPERVLFQRITAAVGHTLPRDIRDEAIGDLCVMALDGRVTLAQIAKGAAKARSGAFANFANKFGPRSIDMDITGDGFALIDTLVDDSASSWLEEMGATAW